MATMKIDTLRWSDEQLVVMTRAFAAMRTSRFLAAHEQFEELWRAAAGEPRRVLHGLAQLAASHHQLTLGRGAAAVRTWNKARTKLAGQALEALCREMEALHAALGLSAEGPRFFDPRALEAFQSLPTLDVAMLHTPNA
jgi:Domain of unknown function (DUF309)